MLAAGSTFRDSLALPRKPQPTEHGKDGHAKQEQDHHLDQHLQPKPGKGRAFLDSAQCIADQGRAEPLKQRPAHAVAAKLHLVAKALLADRNHMSDPIGQPDFDRLLPDPHVAGEQVA